MKLERMIEEIYDAGNKQYSAGSMAPRKDFAPVSTTGNYNYPYQKNMPSDVPTIPPPDAPVSYPWPLQTIVDDLSDSFVYLIAAANKMAQCAKNNPTLKQKEKDSLIELYKKSKKALLLIKDVGMSIDKVVNIAGPQPSQAPSSGPESIKPESQPESPTVAIKIS
jgi:hypothetical protein